MIILDLIFVAAATALVMAGVAAFLMCSLVLTMWAMELYDFITERNK